MSVDNPYKVVTQPDLHVQFSYVDDYFTRDYVSVNNVLEYPTPTIWTDVYFQFDSPSDFFNTYLAEDKDHTCIVYYPVWQDTIEPNPLPLSLEVMNAIESNQIPLTQNVGNTDVNYGWEEFQQLYGAGARRWITEHELYTTEVYRQEDGRIREYTTRQTHTEYYDFQITDEQGYDPEQLKYSIRPIVGQKNNGVLLTLDVVYICKLFNRQTKAQIIRSSSMSIPNPDLKYGIETQRLNVSNMNRYIIFNKYEKSNDKPITIPGKTRVVYEKIFYTDTDILISSNEGERSKTPVLRMYDTEHFYKFSVYQYNKKKELTRMDISGPFEYVLILRTDRNADIEIKPTNSQNMNTVLGELEFRITDNVAYQILGTDNPRYIIKIKTASGASSVICEGKIEQAV